MLVKNIGNSIISIVVKHVHYQFSPNQELSFPDKDIHFVEDAILPYDDLVITSDNDVQAAAIEAGGGGSDPGLEARVAALESGAVTISGNKTYLDNFFFTPLTETLLKSVTNYTVGDYSDVAAGNSNPVHRMIAIPFTVTEPVSARGIALKLKNTGVSVSMSVNFHLDSGGNPDVIVGTTNASNITSPNFTFVDFMLPLITITFPGLYWAVFTLPTNVHIEYSSASTAKTSTDGGLTWNLDSNHNVLFKHYIVKSSKDIKIETQGSQMSAGSITLKTGGGNYGTSVVKIESNYLDMSNSPIKNLSAPVDDQDATPKIFVTTAISDALNNFTPPPSNALPVMANNTYIQWRDAGNTADIGVIKLGDDDQVYIKDQFEFNTTSIANSMIIRTINRDPSTKHLVIASGDSGNNNSGNVTIQTGSADNIRGKVFIDSPALNVASLSGPSNPVDGDIWFDGANLYIQIAGVTKVFTVV